ncbi:hypothetical protein BC936DRAFT_138861 [Jimgerdemannia flammicorona]|uniref:Uncharacterized protein n=1 Tax=Jimgerdemannia flammicorona TaxID=994334 RepID=A0A433BFN5_9FUNG|nr:hypothetical protein BC936DRAFT_138861 [Jimgerdemannia flammicorona]
MSLIVEEDELDFEALDYDADTLDLGDFNPDDADLADLEEDLRIVPNAAPLSPPANPTKNNALHNPVRNTDNVASAAKMIGKSVATPDVTAPNDPDGNEEGELNPATITATTINTRPGLKPAAKSLTAATNNQASITPDREDGELDPTATSTIQTVDDSRALSDNSRGYRSQGGGGGSGGGRTMRDGGNAMGSNGRGSGMGMRGGAGFGMGRGGRGAMMGSMGMGGGMSGMGGMGGMSGMGGMGMGSMGMGGMGVMGGGMDGMMPIVNPAFAQGMMGMKYVSLYILLSLGYFSFVCCCRRLRRLARCFRCFRLCRCYSVSACMCVGSFAVAVLFLLEIPMYTSHARIT